jgi:hypothetical protein
MRPGRQRPADRPTGAQVLAVLLGDNDADASTVREYLLQLLRELWREGEGFSGKRPFGNSGWEYEIYEGLVRAGIIEGALDSDGYLVDFDEAEAHRLVVEAIDALGEAAS